MCIDPSVAPCLRDRLSVHGLRRLQADRSDWAVVLAGHLPAGSDLADDPTVHAALGAGVLDWAALQRLGPDAFRRHRQSCARVAQVAGELRLSELTDDALQVVRCKLEGAGLAPESISRALTVLRRLARRWAAEVSQEARVTSRPTRATTKAVKPPPRVVWTPEQVSQLLAALRDRGVRVAMGLTVGAGLGPGEARHVMHVDLDLRHHRLLVYGLDRSRAPRMAVLPAWVEDLVRDHLDAWTHSRRPPSPWLLPAARDPHKPRGDISKPLQVAQSAAGLDGMPPVNLMSLRRTFQAAALYAGLPREAVRGTWRLAQDGSTPPWWPHLQRLARRDWRTLCGLSPARFPRANKMIMTRDGLLTVEIAEARRAVPIEPPALPPSALP